MLVWVHTLSRQIADAMCGFRLYPIAPAVALDDRVRIGRRMEFDTDIIVRLFWAGVPGSQSENSGDLSGGRRLALPDAARQPAHGMVASAIAGRNADTPTALAASTSCRPGTVSSVNMSTDRRPDSHWASLPESGSTAWLWIMYLSYVWIGRPLFRLLVWPASWYFIAVRPVARRASIEYQRRVGVLAADSSAWQAWRAAGVHVRHFADTLLDKALVWTGGLALDGIRREVDPRFDDAVDENRGGVLVVAHFGNLEVLRRMGERAKQLRLHILVHTRHAERFNRMLTRMNPQSAERLLQVTEVDTATIAHLAARVELGDFVVIAADRVPGYQRTSA